MIKKQYLILFALLVSTLVTLFIFMKKNEPKLKPNEIEVGDKVIQTTGVVVDEDGPESISQMIRLIDLGRIDGDGFSFVSPGNGRINVELKEPYDQNKSKAINWLINNGYSAINPESLIYIELDK